MSIKIRDGFGGDIRAGVAELVDAPDLGSGIFGCGGSSPFARTITSENLIETEIMKALKGNHADC